MTAFLRALLYIRVSTEEQGKGYSLRQQLETLQDYCKANGIEVVGVYEDKASGAYIDRPGLDALREVVSAGGVDLVLTQDRDRLSREPAYRFLLEKEFEEYGTKIRSLNDHGDDSPGGELTDGVLDQVAKYERAMTTERTRRGKIQKARSGKIIGSGKPPYGFFYQDDHYHIDAQRMPYVHEMFNRAAAGDSLYSIAQHLTKIGAPTSNGGMWHPTTVRKILQNDTYKGVYYWGKKRFTSTTIPKGYKKKVVTEERPESEWIAIPVPDSGISAETVDRARELLNRNVKSVSKNSERTWELSGGVSICCECGSHMSAYTTTNRHNKKYFYYICSRRTYNSCSNRKFYRASELEEQVKDAIVEASRPGTWQSFVNDMCDRELQDLRWLHRSDPEKTKENLAGRIKTLETKKTRLVDLFTDGDISKETYREKKSSFQEEIDALRQEFSKVDELDADISRVEDIRYTLLHLENPLSGHYRLIDLPSDRDVVTDEDSFYGDREMAARRRQIFYRSTGMKVKVGEEIEISMGIVGDRVSKKITVSPSATVSTARTGGATSAAERSTTISGPSSPPRPRFARSR